MPKSESTKQDAATYAISKRQVEKYHLTIKAVQKAQEMVTDLAVSDIGPFLLYPECMGHLRQAIEYLIHAKPHSLCNRCDGHGEKNEETCFHCKGHGWLPNGVAKNHDTGRK